MTQTVTTPTRRNDFAENLKADSRLILDACGVPARPNWINRQVVTYLDSVEHTGFPFGPWLVSRVQLTAEQRRRAMNDPELTRVFKHSDRTGEAAVWNVMHPEAPRRRGDERRGR